ncbi:MAG: hypothetical protein LIO44_00915, partial [Eubacterium sp.]|nr:hypothetical protein [Eubacterium sp.]
SKKGIKKLTHVIEDIKEDIKAEGRAEGEAKGRAEEKENVAMEMIKDNVEPSVINKFTKVSLDRINELNVL